MSTIEVLALICPHETPSIGTRVLRCDSSGWTEDDRDEGIEVHRLTEAFIIRQGDEGTAVAEICRKAGISQATYFNWKKMYSGMMPSEMKRLRELEEENNRLKRIVADLSLDKEMLQDIVRRKI
jgi:putative transposase